MQSIHPSSALSNVDVFPGLKHAYQSSNMYGELTESSRISRANSWKALDRSNFS